MLLHVKFLPQPLLYNVKFVGLLIFSCLLSSMEIGEVVIVHGWIHIWKMLLFSMNTPKHTDTLLCKHMQNNHE